MIEKVFRDPVHTYIHVDHQVIYDLINTKEFQRLRRIKQLGTSGYTFHGGEHSRFSHCLGAYEIARRITKIFDEKYLQTWDNHESLLVCLLYTSVVQIQTCFFQPSRCLQPDKYRYRKPR